MRSYFDNQLRDLSRELTRMGAQCEKILGLITQALERGDLEPLSGLPRLGGEIDRMERSIESACLKLLLQQQPVARDLRQISAALKMITDLERIGDQAEDIGEIIPFLQGHVGEECQTLCRMAEAAGKMVTLSVDAYVRQDLSLAQAVIRRDDEVDAYFSQLKAAMIQRIRRDTADGEYAVDLIMIAKYFERIGDHATNIAEWVAFCVTGVHESEETQ